MKLTRTFKRCISIALVGVLFFAQMAVAAYVCPVQSGATTGQQQVAANPMPAMSDMAGCDGMDGMDGVSMDSDSPSLCHASCSNAGQSDRTPTLKLPVVTLHSVPFVVLPAAPMVLQDLAVSAYPTQSVTASPPLSVLYCCLRI